MQQLDGVREWFFNCATLNGKAGWALKKRFGNTWKLVMSHTEATAIANPDASFETLQSMILDEYSNGVREFEITFKGSKNDPSNKSKSLILPYRGTQGAQAGHSVAGMYGQQQPQFIGQISTLQNQNFQTQIALERERFEKQLQEYKREVKHTAELAELKNEIAGIREDNRDNFERLLEKAQTAFQVIDSSPTVQGIVSKFFPQLGLAGIAGTTTTSIKEIAAATTESVNAPSTPPTPASVDFNPVITAKLSLLNAGWTDDESNAALLNVVEWATKQKKEDALNMINQFLK